MTAVDVRKAKEPSEKTKRYDWKLALNDYVIVQLLDGKRTRNEIGTVISTTKGSAPYKIKLVSYRPVISGETSVISSDDMDTTILANLGHKLPRSSSPIFGVTPYAICSNSESKFGPISWFYDFDPELMKHVLSVLSKCRKNLRSMECWNMFPFQTFISPSWPGQKMLGCYMRVKKQPVDIINLFVNPRLEEGKLSPLTVYHEFAHGLWTHCLNDLQRIEFMQAYSKTVELKIVPEKDIQLIMADLKTAGSVKALKKEHGDSPVAKAALKSLLDHAFFMYRLKPKDIDAMLKAEMDIAEYIQHNKKPFPALIRNIDTKISQNADREPVEMFCEAFALYANEEDLPENILKLVEDTLDSMVARQ